MSLIIFKVFYYPSLIILLFLDLLTFALIYGFFVIFLILICELTCSRAYLWTYFCNIGRNFGFVFVKYGKDFLDHSKYKSEPQTIRRIGRKVFDSKRTFSAFFWPKAQPKLNELPYCHLLPVALDSCSITVYTHCGFQFDLCLWSLEIFLMFFQAYLYL